MEGTELGSILSKEGIRPVKYLSRKRRGHLKEIMGSTSESNTFPKKRNGVRETSLAGAQNSSPLPKESIEFVLALRCPQQSPEKKQKTPRKNKSLEASPNTGILSEVNCKVRDSTLCEDQNQDVSINQGVNAHEQVCTVVRKRRTNRVNKPLMECGTNIEVNIVEAKHPSEKLLEVMHDPPGGKVLTTATASMVNNKLVNSRPRKKNKFVNSYLWYELEHASETEGEQEVCEAQQKRRKKKSNVAASQTVDEQELCEVSEKFRKEKSEEAGSQTVTEEVGRAQQERRKKKSKEAVSQTVEEQEVCKAREKLTGKIEEAVSPTADEEVCEARQKRRKKKSKEAVPQTVDEQEVCDAREKRRKTKSKESALQTVDEQELCKAWEKPEAEKSEEAVSLTADKEACETRQKRSRKKSKEAAYQTIDEQEVCEFQQKRKKKKKNREVESQIEDKQEAGEDQKKKKKKKKNKEVAVETEDKQEVREAWQTEDEQEVCETQKKRRNKKCLGAAIQTTQHEQEVCEAQQKSGKKKLADQESNNLLESMSDITKTMKSELENADPEISECGLMINQEEILLDNSCLAMQSKSLPDSAITPSVVANSVATYRRKVKDKDSDSSVSKKERSKLKVKPMVLESIQSDKSLESISRFDCSSDHLQQENLDSSKFHTTVQKSEYLVEQTPADSPTDCREDNKSTLLETDNLVDGSCSHTLNEVSELGNRSLKKKKSKKTSKTKMIQSTNEACDLSKVQKTRHDCDIVAVQAIKDFQNDHEGNNNLSFLKTNDHADEIHSPILRASEQANPSELGKEDCDISSQDNIFAVDNSSATQPNKKKKHKKDKSKHISDVIDADEAKTTASNGCQVEELVPSIRDDENDTVMAKDCQTGEIGPSVGSKIGAVMVGTEIDNPSERIGFVDDSSADLTKKRSASRKKQRKDKSKSTYHEANTLVGSSIWDTCLGPPDSNAEGGIATFFNGGEKGQIPLIGDGTNEKINKKDEVNHPSQVIAADETNTTALNGRQIEEIVPSTRDVKNDNEEIGSSAGSKTDTAMVRTEINNLSERIESVDDASAALTKKRSASRKRRRKDKSENTSLEANTVVGLSTLDTSMELQVANAEGSIATSFNSGQEKIPLIGDVTDECVLKNECVMDRKPPCDVGHENNAVIVGPTVSENVLGKRSASPEREPIVHAGRKLLILDLNGLLVDIVSDLPKGYKADTRISRKALIKRPFCDDFLKFCFDKFNVGVWSSRTKKNVDSVVDYIFGDMRHKLLFCWDQSHCTETGFNTIENDCKPLVFKELKKLWEKRGHVEGLELPWEMGEFNESNTLLLDDSPYKALLNPRHTAIFPRSYMFRHAKDKSLGPGGDIRKYLESVAAAEHVQKFVEQNSFGQHPITTKNPSWKYYLNIIKANKFCLPT